jgi:muramoyltetrapeptide carboxypeptidase
VRPGSRVVLVAPASAFSRAQFDAGVIELRRIGLDPVWDDDVFEKSAITAGGASLRAASLLRAFDGWMADAVIAVRGGYGSAEILPLLDVDRLVNSRTAFVGYSDVTAIHGFLGAHGLASVHGAMVEGRLAKGPQGYDANSFLRSLSTEPLGELRPDGLESLLSAGGSFARGPLAGGTMTQLLASFGTPFEFKPPDGHVLFIDEVNERPYRIHRMLTQWRLSGRLERAAAIVFGQLPGCDEPGGKLKARDVILDALHDYRGPVLFGFPSGHTTSAMLSMPLGVACAVVADPARPAVIFEEAAAAD